MICSGHPAAVCSLASDTMYKQFPHLVFSCSSLLIVFSTVFPHQHKIKGSACTKGLIHSHLKK